MNFKKPYSAVFNKSWKNIAEAAEIFRRKYKNKWEGVSRKNLMSTNASVSQAAYVLMNLYSNIYDDEKLLVTVEDKDLPLYINREWATNVSAESYKKRMRAIRMRGKA